MARIVTEDYIPTYQDILHVRSPTDRITEQCISFEKTTLRYCNGSAKYNVGLGWNLKRPFTQILSWLGHHYETTKLDFWIVCL